MRYNGGAAPVAGGGARAFFHRDWLGAPLMPLAPSFPFWQAPFLPDVHVLLAVAAFRLITFWVWVGVGWMALLRVPQWPPAPAAAPEKES